MAKILWLLGVPWLVDAYTSEEVIVDCIDVCVCDSSQLKSHFGGTAGASTNQVINSSSSIALASFAEDTETDGGQSTTP